MTNERGIWTSASAAEADALCPGRHRAQRDLPETTSADAQLGNRVHAALAGELIAIDDEEFQLVEKCRNVEDWLINQLFSDTPETYRERRYWIDCGEYRHSGKPDAVHIVRNVALVVDFKTGRNEVADSPRNLQLRDLAVLAAVEHKLETVHVAIIQPWVTMKPEVCTYSKQDLIFALNEMEARVIASNQPNAPRFAGDKQCKYCKAKSVCPEAREMALAIPAQGAAYVQPLGANAIALSLSNEVLAAFLDKASVAESVIQSCRDEAKRRIESGATIPGYRLKEGAKRETITDAQECFNRCSAIGVPLANFMDAITVSKGKLKEAVKLATGNKGKALDSTLSDILNGIVETKQAAPVLAKE